MAFDLIDTSASQGSIPTFKQVPSAGTRTTQFVGTPVRVSLHQRLLTTEFEGKGTVVTGAYTVTLAGTCQHGHLAAVVDFAGKLKEKRTARVTRRNRDRAHWRGQPRAHCGCMRAAFIAPTRVSYMVLG